MGKIYGFKESDVKRLFEFLQKNEGLPLSEVFLKYGIKYGKSKGTVRNLYYAMAKKSKEDKSFRDEFLCGKIFAVKKNEKFGAEEGKSLVETILKSKAQGKSVRKVVNEMAGGDVRLALRLQNKFRNATKSERRSAALRSASALIPDAYLAGLKREINGLYDRLFNKLKKENAELKKSLAEERLKNVKLRKGVSGGAGALSYFALMGENELVN